jgi:hypothetical protein
MRSPGRPRGRPLPSLGLAIFVIAAVAFGVAAALLAAPYVTPPASTGSAPTLQTNTVLSEAVELSGIVFLLGMFGYFLVRRLTGGSASIPGRAVTPILVVLLLLVVFVLVSRLVSPGPLPPSEGSTGCGAPPCGTNSSSAVENNSTANSSLFGTYSGLGLHLPGWWIYAALLGVVAIALLVVLPLLSRRVGTREPPAPADADPEAIRRSLQETLAELGRGEGGPRERIIRAYGRLLTRVASGTGDLATLTPREIERLCRTRLRIQVATAHEITALFEEARYSTHPMGSAEVDRAERSLARALKDLEGPLLPEIPFL